MSTFTDKEMIKEIKERIGSLDVRDNIERRAYEIALASLEAEPVAWQVTITKDGQDSASTIYRDCAEKDTWVRIHETLGSVVHVTPLYMASPVPVVPEEKTMPNPLSMYAVDAVAAIAEVRGWNACRAAMLQGKGK
ncbi:hypothetical protein EIG70_003568 [Escherichia coli O174:H21]|nr:hypothetical protein [Escherichia coli O174:H21]